MKIIKPSIKFEDKNIQKLTEDIYKHLEKLSNAVNNLSGVQGSSTNNQNIVVEQQKDGSYKLKVRHQNGFVEVDATLSTGV